MLLFSSIRYVTVDILDNPEVVEEIVISSSRGEASQSELEAQYVVISFSYLILCASEQFLEVSAGLLAKNLFAIVRLHRLLSLILSKCSDKKKKATPKPNRNIIIILRFHMILQC